MVQQALALQAQHTARAGSGKVRSEACLAEDGGTQRDAATAGQKLRAPPSPARLNMAARRTICARMSRGWEPSCGAAKTLLRQLTCGRGPGKPTACRHPWRGPASPSRAQLPGAAALQAGGEFRAPGACKRSSSGSSSRGEGDRGPAALFQVARRVCCAAAQRAAAG